MAKVPLTDAGFNDIRLAVISTGGTVPVSDYGLDDLVATADWTRFDPAYLDGATSKAQITSIGQFRGYPRDRWGNEEQSGNFQKQCSGDGVGSWHTYTVPADTYYSFADQDAANTLAENDVTDNGQAYANSVAGGYCTWHNDEMSATYYKEGCGYKGEGSSYYHNLAAGSVSSTVSKSQANTDGQALMNSQGQSHVNSAGYCTWRSEARTDNIRRANCGDYGTGSYVSVTATENQFSSTSSLNSANAVRDGWMQQEANENGSCTYSFPSDARAANIQKEGCGYKGVGSWVYVTADAGQFTSPHSVYAANIARDSWMQWKANSDGYCTWYSEYRSDSIQRDNCDGGQIGSYVSVTANEDQFSSTTSLVAANTARDSWMQGQANANGSCTPLCQNPLLSVAFINMASETQANYAVTITNAAGRTYNFAANSTFGLPASITADDGNGNIVVKKMLNDILALDVFFYPGGGCGISGVTSQDIVQMQDVPYNGATTPITSTTKGCVNGTGEKAALVGHAPSGGLILWSNGMVGSPVLVENGTFVAWATNINGASNPSAAINIGIC